MEGSGASSPTLAQRSEHSSHPRAAEEHRCMCDQLRTRIPRALIYGMRVPVRHAWGSQARAVPPCPRPSPPRTSPGGASPAPGLTGLGDICYIMPGLSPSGAVLRRAVPKGCATQTARVQTSRPSPRLLTDHRTPIPGQRPPGAGFRPGQRHEDEACVVRARNRHEDQPRLAFEHHGVFDEPGDSARRLLPWARLTFGAHSWCVCVRAGGIVQAIHFEQTRDGCEPDLAGAPPRPVWKPAQDVAGAQLGGTSHCTSLNQLSG